MQRKRFVIPFLITIVAFTSTLHFFSHFLTFIEERHGVALADGVLVALPPHDVTWPIFLVVYSFLILAISILAKDPKRFLVALQAYTLLVLIRVVTLYLTPLSPPPGMIILRDPFVELFASGQSAGARVLTQDLFFSGHTSLLFLLTCLMKTSFLRALFLFATVVIAVLVLIQHAHYTIDVVAAPFFSYGCYRLALRLNFLPNSERKSEAQ